MPDEVGKCVVLIVDDHPDTARVVALLTESELGCETIVTHGGEEALQVVRERAVDLIILDYNMPGLSGVDVLRQLPREIQRVPPPIVVFHSADESIEPLAIELGAAAVVRKTEATTRLLPTIKEHLARRTG